MCTADEKKLPHIWRTRASGGRRPWAGGWFPRHQRPEKLMPHIVSGVSAEEMRRKIIKCSEDEATSCDANFLTKQQQQQQLL